MVARKNFISNPSHANGRQRRRYAAPWAVLVTALSVSSAPAQTAKIVGLGATGCSQFTADVGQNPAAQRDYLAWAQGFMSGVLLGRPTGVDDKLDLNPPTLPLLKQLEFLRHYCRGQPSDDFSDAVLALYKLLRQGGAT